MLLNWKAAVFFSAHVFIGTAASDIRAFKLFWHQKKNIETGTDYGHIAYDGLMLWLTDHWENYSVTRHVAVKEQVDFMLRTKS